MLKEHILENYYMNKLEATRAVMFFDGLPEEQFIKLADIAVVKKFRRDRFFLKPMFRLTDFTPRPLAG